MADHNGGATTTTAHHDQHDDHPVTHHAADTDALAHAAAHAAERGDVYAAVVVALDESDGSAAVLDFALDARQETDDLYLLAILPPLAMAVSAPVAPIATSVGMAGVAHSWEAQRALDQKAAAALLRSAARKALARGVPRANIHAHVLPAGGGASGVAASISEFVRARHGKGDGGGGAGKKGGGGGADDTKGGGVALVVVGSRGMGPSKAALMSALGLGSVSDYVLNHSPAPVAIVRPAVSGGAPPSPSSSASSPRVVVLALDESPHSSAALLYAAERGLLGGAGGAGGGGAPPPLVRVRVACSAAATPFPVLDETAAAMAVESSRAWQEAGAQAEAYALEVAERHARAAKDLLLRRALGKSAGAGAGAGGGDGNAGATGVATAEDEASALARLDITAVSLKGGGGGTADAGAAVAAYARAEGASLLVVGSRGMGALRAAVAGLVGLGSVSLFLAHHAPCPLVVVRPAEGGEGPAVAAGNAGGGGAAKVGEGKQD